MWHNLCYQIRKLAWSTRVGYVNTQLSCRLPDTKRLRRTWSSLTMLMPTNYDYSLSLITFQLRRNTRYYLSSPASLIQTVDLESTCQNLKKFRKVTKECSMKVHFLKIWYGLCWTFPLLICLYFHFQVDNTQAELKHGDISAILFWVHCDFFIISRNRGRLN